MKTKYTEVRRIEGLELEFCRWVETQPVVLVKGYEANSFSTEDGFSYFKVRGTTTNSYHRVEQRFIPLKFKALFEGH